MAAPKTGPGITKGQGLIRSMGRRRLAPNDLRCSSKRRSHSPFITSGDHDEFAN